MIRTLLRAALVAALVTAGGFLAPRSAMADPPDVTNCNRNNPGRGCPRGIRDAQPNNPVCSKGRHVGNPHCSEPGARPTPPPPPPGPPGPTTRVRSAGTRTTPRANKAVAPRRGTAVSTKAGKAL